MGPLAAYPHVFPVQETSSGLRTESTGFGYLETQFKVRGYASSYKLWIPGSIWAVTEVGIRQKLIPFRCFHVFDENPLRDDFCEDSPCIMTS